MANERNDLANKTRILQDTIISEAKGLFNKVVIVG